MRGTTLEALIADKQHCDLICDVLSDIASCGKFPKRASYQVIRSLTPVELFDIYTITIRQGNDEFRKQFGFIYHHKRGNGLGPLFQPSDSYTQEQIYG